MCTIHKKPGGNHRAFFLLFVLVLMVSQNKDLDEYGLQIIIVLVVVLEMLLITRTTTFGTIAGAPPETLDNLSWDYSASPTV